MHPLINESFDRFARYQHVERVREALTTDSIDILDVGDPYGTLGWLFPDDRTVSVDVYAEELPEDERHRHIIASGFNLPFADHSFDLVTCHDTLEHVPLERKTGFIAELLRVSRGPVLVVAPFADPRTSWCEQMANAYYVARLGYEMYQLTEHAASGLPDLREVLAWADQLDIPYAVRSDGWLYHWLAFMLIKIHLLSEYADDAHRRVDTAINTVLHNVDRGRPHYRRAIVFRPPPGMADSNMAEPTDGSDVVQNDLRVLASVATELSIALPKGTDPFDNESPLRRWISARTNRGDEVGALATDLERVINAVADIDPPSPMELSGQLAAVTKDQGARPPQEETASEAESQPALPIVSVVLVNLNGAEHLPDCLDSLREQDYPRDRVEVLVVDNASADDSLSLLSSRYPWVRVLPQSQNTGFAAAVNIGAREATGDCLVLVNNDARLDPAFLRELVARFDPGTGAVCVGSRILSWDGSTIDFVDGAINYYGMGMQLGYGQPVSAMPSRDGAELLFACGGAMLIDRRTFLNLGGFDPGFFAYFEDVDLGWRLWLCGFRVVFAERAVAYHKMHGTSSRFPLHQRYLLYERNALRMIIKNYSDANLARVLGPALLLMAKRAVLRGELDRSAYVIGGDRAVAETVPRLSLAHLHAMNDIVDSLDEIIEARAAIQGARRRSDEDILARFQRPFWPVMDEAEYIRASESISRTFDLESIFNKARAARVLVVCNDGVGERMSGPSIRAVEIAKALAATVNVTLAVPDETNVELPGVAVAVFSSERDLRILADSSEVVLFQGYTLAKMPSLLGTSALLVADLYDPWLFENIELHTGESDADAILRGDATVLNTILDQCDFFICASERQRDYWLGMLSSRHRLTQAQYAKDPTLRNLIDVVPFGLPDREPQRTARVLKGVHPSIAPDDLVVLWGGGAWDWFDPLTLVEAWPAVISEVPNARLWFMGLHLTTENVDHMRVAHQATLRAKELGLTDVSIFFGDWVPYELRESYLLEADLGVTVARDLAETRLSFRTRVLDYLWAGLPVVATDGDVLSDLIRNERLGGVVPPGDPSALSKALIALLTEPLVRDEMSRRSRLIAQRFRWSAAITPLNRMIEEPWSWEAARTYLPRKDRVTEEARALFDDLAKRRGQIISGPGAAASKEMALMEGSIARAEQIVRDYPYVVRAVYRVRKARELGPRGTAVFVRERLTAKLSRRRRS